MSLKNDVLDMVLQMTAGSLEGIRKGDRLDKANYVDLLIKAKEAGVDPNMVPEPEWLETHNIYVEAMLSQRSKLGAEGGLEWSFINLSGEYKKEEQSAVKVAYDLHMKSQNAPDWELYRSLSVDDAKKLMQVVNG